MQQIDDEQQELVQIQQYLKNPEIIEHFPCQEVKLNGFMYKSQLIVTQTELIVLREIPDVKGMAYVFQLILRFEITLERIHFHVLFTLDLSPRWPNGCCCYLTRDGSCIARLNTWESSGEKGALREKAKIVERAGEK